MRTSQRSCAVDHRRNIVPRSSTTAPSCIGPPRCNGHALRSSSRRLTDHAALRHTARPRTEGAGGNYGRYARDVRKLLFVAALAACSKSSPTVYVSVGTGDVPAAAHVMESADGVAVVALHENQLASLSRHMHEEGRCGGFMVHDTLDDALGDLHVAKEKPFEYTIDRAAVVAAVVPQL